MSLKIKPPPIPPSLTATAQEVAERANELYQFLLSGPSLPLDLVSELSEVLGDANHALEECGDLIACELPDVAEHLTDETTRYEQRSTLRRDFARLADEEDVDEGEVAEWAAGDGDDGE